MKALEIRNKFIEFFERNNHHVIPGASLIPENDPSVLFTTAGMHPLVPFLLGEPHPMGKRLVDYQKCLRTDDIDEVGDDIHVTFFEMLGNWSLGVYFKKEAIELSYDFLVNHLKLDVSRLAVTVFAGDEDIPRDVEAAKVWEDLGVKKENIYYCDRSNNWWGPAGVTGPCGPDTEIFYDSLKPKCSEECGPSCDCGKYWEIWNNVFMEYNKNEDSTYSPLKNKNVDTGLGLERITAILENKANVYETELFSDVIKEIRSLATNPNETSIRIIAEHIRASCFLIVDGITPGNVEQGYVLRRLIRRTLRHMKKIGVSSTKIESLILVTIEALKDLYGELVICKAIILKNIIEEMNKFLKTLELGEKKFAKVVESCNSNKIRIIDGKTVFNLYDTFGFPPEITAELAKEKGLSIDLEEYESLFKKHQQLSRQGAANKFKGGLADNTEETTALHTATHILHRALQIILGEHALQRGSNITKERLRFDFSHPQKLTKEELHKVEDLVNKVINEGLPVKCEEMTLEEAKASNAKGLFSDKYGSIVKVYSIGDFSKEICGGPHVENTSKLGYFKIVKEESASAGVRRIKAILQNQIQ
jgi:alanyl-tRNA synthetase